MAPLKSLRDLTLGLFGNLNHCNILGMHKAYRYAEQQELILIIEMEIILKLPSLQIIILQ